MVIQRIVRLLHLVHLEQVIPSSENLKCLIGSLYGEFKMGFSMTTCGIWSFLLLYFSTVTLQLIPRVMFTTILPPGRLGSQLVVPQGIMTRYTVRQNVTARITCTHFTRGSVWYIIQMIVAV
jgi:hypothetical protein